MPLRPRASRATSTVSRTVSSGNSVAAWNDAPEPLPGPRRRRQVRSRRRPAARRGLWTERSRRWRSSAWSCRRRWCRSARRSRRGEPRSRRDRWPCTPPKVTTMSWSASVTSGLSRAHGRSRRIDDRARSSPLLEWEAASAPSYAVDGATDPVGDVDEAAREVEQQNQQTQARREQRDELVGREQRREADHVDRPDDRTGDRAHAADDDHRHEQQRTCDGVPGVGERHPLGDAGEQAAAEPGDGPRQRERAQLRRSPDERCRPPPSSRCPARRA